MQNNHKPKLNIKSFIANIFAMLKQSFCFCKKDEVVPVTKYAVKTKKEATSKYAVKTKKEATSKYAVKTKKEATSKYKGVHWSKASSKWIASTRVNGKKKYIGSFNTEIEAYMAYTEFESKKHLMDINSGK